MGQGQSFMPEIYSFCLGPSKSTIILFLNTISIIWKLKPARVDREIKILISRCDICENHIVGAPDDLEYQLDMLTNTDNIPRLILCDSCQTEYHIPSWVCSMRKHCLVIGHCH